VGDKLVLLPQPIEDEAVAVLRTAGLELVTAKEPKPEIVAPLLKGAGAIVLRTGIRITRELLDEADELLTISRTGAGVDNVDLDAATSKGVLVTSSLGVNTSSVMEHTLALMMALFKQLHLMDKEVRSNNFSIRYKNLPSDLREKTLGLVGFGRIGSSLARACHDIFNMRILAFDEYLPENIKTACKDWVEFLPVEELARQADVISIHIPLTEETRHFFNASFFKKMKKSAFLLNTSRGGVVNEADLIQALKDKVIAGAGLDVFENEPIHGDSGLLTLSNVVLTPHTAALTAECVIRMAVSGAERVVEVFQGKLPGNIANPKVLEHPRWKSWKK
jgi:D-3-phosphoglycerate dehydrogenase